MKHVKAEVAVSVMLVTLRIALARPEPGEVFREYFWDPGRVRVGVKWDETNHGSKIFTGPSMDLDKAVKAEAEIQKVLCHDGTTGLSIKMNGHDWLTFPEADAIPEPRQNYQHMTYPNVEIPTEHLKDGANTFQLKVDLDDSFNQNLIYGIVFRVYYSDDKPHASGTLTSPSANGSIGMEAEFSVEVEGSAEKVEYIGWYRDFNWEGDGVYTQWHYHFFHKDLKRHVGTATDGPDFPCTWNTEWIPDQSESMKFMAKIHGPDGIISTTPAVEGVTFDRGNHVVELCTTWNVPQKWVTRKGNHSCNFEVTGDLSEAVDAKMVFCSWSPGYANGIGVNGHEVITSEGARYRCHWHEIPTPVEYLQAGENTAFTNKTPKHNGKMVHGMEVNWPGICVLVRYESDAQTSSGPGRRDRGKRASLTVSSEALKSPQLIRVYRLSGESIEYRRSGSAGGCLLLEPVDAASGIYYAWPVDNSESATISTEAER